MESRKRDNSMCITFTLRVSFKSFQIDFFNYLGRFLKPNWPIKQKHFYLMQVIMLVKGNFGCFIVKYIIIQMIKTSNNDKFKCYSIQKLINLSTGKESLYWLKFMGFWTIKVKNECIYFMQMCAFVLKVLSEVMLQR